jgi:hypothetical protein
LSIDRAKSVGADCPPAEALIRSAEGFIALAQLGALASTTLADIALHSNRIAKSSRLPKRGSMTV